MHIFTPRISGVYIEIPIEDWELGDDERVAKLILSLCWTRDAAQNWAKEYTQQLQKLGFIVGNASACNFRHQTRNMSMIVDGDNFTISAPRRGPDVVGDQVGEGVECEATDSGTKRSSQRLEHLKEDVLLLVDCFFRERVLSSRSYRKSNVISAHLAAPCALVPHVQADLATRVSSMGTLSDGWLPGGTSTLGRIMTVFVVVYQVHGFVQDRHTPWLSHFCVVRVGTSLQHWLPGSPRGRGSTSQRSETFSMFPLSGCAN